MLLVYPPHSKILAQYLEAEFASRILDEMCFHNLQSIINFKVVMVRFEFGLKAKQSQSVVSGRAARFYAFRLESKVSALTGDDPFRFHDQVRL